MDAFGWAKMRFWRYDGPSDDLGVICKLYAKLGFFSSSEEAARKEVTMPYLNEGRKTGAVHLERGAKPQATKPVKMPPPVKIPPPTVSKGK